MCWQPVGSREAIGPDTLFTAPAPARMPLHPSVHPQPCARKGGGRAGDRGKTQSPFRRNRLHPRNPAAPVPSRSPSHTAWPTPSRRAPGHPHYSGGVGARQDTLQTPSAQDFFGELHSELRELSMSGMQEAQVQTSALHLQEDHSLPLTLEEIFPPIPALNYVLPRPLCGG